MVDRGEARGRRGPGPVDRPCGAQSRGPWWTARRGGHAQAAGRPAVAAPLARAGARGDGDAGHGKARQGHGRARLATTSAIAGLPSRADDGEEKLIGGGFGGGGASAARRALRARVSRLGRLGVRAGGLRRFL